MIDERSYDAAVGLLYESALDPAQWGKSLAEIARLSRANNIHLLVWDPARTEPTFSHAVGMNEDMEVAYRAHYGAIDPRRLLVSGLEAGKWTACHHHFDSCTVGRSEFFQDYLIPGDIRYLLGTRLVRCGDQHVFVGMHRAPGRAPFSAPEFEFMDRLTSHFQRAVRLWLGTAELRQRAAIGEHAMDATELGVIAISGAGDIKYANRFAEARLREGKLLVVRQGKLAAPAGADTHRLHAAFQQAAISRHGQSFRLGTPGQSDTCPCYVTILPVGSTGPLALRFHAVTLLVLISHVRLRRTITVQQLMAIFGLTPAEARLARSVSSGESMAAYAAASAISMNTLKTQLKSVFIKTGTTRQAELAQTVSVIPVVR